MKHTQQELLHQKEFDIDFLNWVNKQKSIRKKLQLLNKNMKGGKQ